MRKRLLLLVCGALAPLLVAAQTLPLSPTGAACQRPNNRVLGPRTSDRPLPLLSGDAARGFHPACTVPWRTLSPRNEALPVTACFRGSLLQIPNHTACGGGTGPLWVSSRWVMTSAELDKPAVRAATCQQLDTGAWAGTRAFDFDCVPQKKELKVGDQPPAESSTHAPADGTRTPLPTAKPAPTTAPSPTNDAAAQAIPEPAPADAAPAEPPR
jgi:hypothetical protein